MSSVIGQGIGLSEKWPGTFVAGERGNDFERRAHPRDRDREKDGGGRLSRPRDKDGAPGRLLLEPVLLSPVRVPSLGARSYVQEHGRASGRARRQHTCRPVYARSCSL